MKLFLAVFLSSLAAFGQITPFPGGGSGGGGSSFTQGWLVTKTDTTHLTIALNSYGLNVAGTLCANPVTPAVISAPTGTGTGFIYVDLVAGCVITAGSNVILTGDANVTIAGGTITAYPNGSYPIATFGVSANAFTTVTNVVTPYSAYPVVGGTNCSVAYSSGVATVTCSPPSYPFSSLTDGAPVTWDAASAQNSNRTLLFTVHSGSRTLNLQNLVSGGNYVLRLIQDGTGGEGLVLGTGCTWKVGGPTPATTVTLATGAAAENVLAFTYDGTNCIANFR